MTTILKNKLTDYYRGKYAKTKITTQNDAYEYHFNDSGIMKGGWNKQFLPNEWNNVENNSDNQDASKAIEHCLQALNDHALFVFKMKHNTVNQIIGIFYN